MKGCKYFLIVVVLFVLFSSSCFAMLVQSPKLSPVSYVPGEDLEGHIYVFDVASDGIVVSSSDDMGNIFEISEVVPEGEGCGFDFAIRFSEIIPESGIHNIDLYISEKPENGGEMIGSYVGLSFHILVEVYSSEKDVKFSFVAPDSNEDEIMNFNFGVQSWSYQDIDSLKGLEEIYNLDSELIDSIWTQEVSLDSMTSASLIAEFDNSNLLPGAYVAKGIVKYDGFEKELEDNFNIGFLNVGVVDWTRVVNSSMITPFEIVIQSNWNNRIDNLYAELHLNDQKVFQTPTVSLDAWENATLESYWDVKEESGIYSATIFAHFDGQTSSKSIDVEVVEAENKMNWSTILIIGAFSVGLLILIAVLVLMILIYRSRLKIKKDSEGIDVSREGIIKVKKSNVGGDSLKKRKKKGKRK